MRKTITVVMALAMLCMITVSPVLAADNTAEVETLIKSKIDAVLEVLKQADTPVEKKKAGVMEIIEPVLDFTLMAKLSLGKQHWSRMTPDQQTEFVEIFTERLKRSYLDKISLYSDQKVIYGQGVSEGGKIKAGMQLITSDSTIDVIYKFYPTQDGWKVYDVEIEGVSFIKSYRAQFDEMLTGKSVTEMLETLRKTAGE